MSNYPHITWTDERKHSVATLLREGLTAGQMSKRLGISRNAIIGIIHRDKALSEIGLQGTIGGARKPKLQTSYKAGRMKTAARKSAVRQASPVPADVVAPVSEAEPSFICETDVSETLLEPFSLPLADLNLRQCRFAVNDAAKGEQHLFCGHPVKIGSSFCEHHHRRVFVRTSKAGAA